MEQTIKLSDQYALQNNQALHAQVDVDADRDANPERRQTLPPSEIVMGAGKPYRVSVAFKEPDADKRWNLYTVDKKTGQPIRPWVGTMVQYTVIESPNGEFDGTGVGEFIMTYVGDKVPTCSAQALLQALRLWNPQQPPRTNMEYIALIEQAIARTPTIGIHVDWEGQKVSVAQDGSKAYTKVDGLNSWRMFPWPTGPDGKHTQPHPSSRIPILDKHGKETGDAYLASARVVRREPSAPVQGQGQQNPWGSAPQQQGQNPFAAGAVQPMPPQQFGQPPNFAVGVAPSQPPNISQAYVWPTPVNNQIAMAPPAQPQQQQAPTAAYQPPVPVQPQQAQPQTAPAPQNPWQTPGPSFR